MPYYDYAALRMLPLDIVIPGLWSVNKVTHDGPARIIYHLSDPEMQVSVQTNAGAADGWNAWDHRDGEARVNSRGNNSGRGAVNLVMAVDGCTELEAGARLERLSPQIIQAQKSAPARAVPEQKPFTFPCTTFNAAQEWATIQNYLVGQRGLPEPLVKKAWQAHQIHVGWGAQAAGYLLFPQRAWDQHSTRPDGPAPVGCAWRWADDHTPTRKPKVRQSGPRPGTRGNEKLDPRSTGWWQLGVGRDAVIAVESAIDGLAFFAAAGSEGRRVTVVAGHGQGGFCAREWQGFPLVGVATDRDVAGDGYARLIATQTRVPVVRIPPPEGKGIKDWADAWQANPTQAKEVAQQGLQALWAQQKQQKHREVEAEEWER